MRRLGVSVLARLVKMDMSMATKNRLLTFTSLAVLLAAGCAPQTRYRRSAVVPTPRGDDLTQDFAGRVEVSGSVAHTDVETDLLPRAGDPALLATETTFDGRVRFRVGEHIAFGLHGLYSHSTFAQQTAWGAPPMHDQSIYGFGPNLSFHVGDRKRYVIGGGFGLTFMNTPWSVWERTSDPTLPELLDDIAGYEQIDEGREMLLLTTLSLGATWVVHPSFELFGGLSVQSSLTNIGFDDQARDGSTLSADEFGVTPFLGATGRIPGGAFVRGQYYVPIGFEQFTLGSASWGGVQLTVGVDIGREDAVAQGVSAPSY